MNQQISGISWVPPLLGPFLGVILFIGFIGFLQFLTEKVVTIPKLSASMGQVSEASSNKVDAPNLSPGDEVQPPVNTPDAPNKHSTDGVLKLSQVEAADVPNTSSKDQVSESSPNSSSNTVDVPNLPSSDQASEASQSEKDVAIQSPTNQASGAFQSNTDVPNIPPRDDVREVCTSLTDPLWEGMAVNATDVPDMSSGDEVYTSPREQVSQVSRSNVVDMPDPPPTKPKLAVSPSNVTNPAHSRQVLQPFPSNADVQSSSPSVQISGVLSHTPVSPVNMGDVPNPSLSKHAQGAAQLTDTMKSGSVIQRPIGIRKVLNSNNTSTMKHLGPGKWKRGDPRFAGYRAPGRTANSMLLHHSNIVKSDIRFIESKSDIEILIRDQKGSKEEKQSFLWNLREMMVQNWNKKYCANHRNDPNMRFVPMQSSNADESNRPLFLPRCGCEWNTESEGRLYEVTPLPPLFSGDYLEFDDDLFLPTIFYPKIKTGPFYDYWGGFQFSFLQKFMELPREIRYSIYELVVFSWAPNMCYPVTNPKLCRNHGIARKNLRPIFHPLKNKVAGQSNEEKRYFELSRQVKKRAGMLDYFKEEEYRNVEALCGSLASFEGRTYQTKLIDYNDVDGEYHDLQRERPRSLGVLNDLMEWFWDNTVIDISATLVSAHWQYADDIGHRGREILTPAKIRRKPREPKHTSPCEHANHHRWISHLTFTTKSSHACPGFGPRMQQEFRGVMDACDYIKLNLPCLRTLRVFIRLGPGQARQVIRSRGNLPWIHSIRDLPTLEKFDCHVLVENPQRFDEKMEKLSTLKLLELTEKVTEILESWKPKVSV